MKFSTGIFQLKNRMVVLFFILLLLLSIGVFSVWFVNVQSERQVGVGEASSNQRGRVLRPIHKQTHPNQRVALVIGNGAYLEKPLRNPPNDSEDMVTVLKQVGFEVELLKEASLQKMKDAIQAFGEKLKTGGVGLFYFAGHGVQYEGRNYLFPIGAMQSVNVAELLPFETLDVGYLLATMQGAKNNLNVVILDACRDNPFARSLFIGRGVSSESGLASLEVPSGTLIAYATSPNRTALDGSAGGRNSPYVKFLKRELPKPGLSIVEVLTNVRVAVKKETKNFQAPGFYSELDSKFCFVEPCGQVVAQTPVAVVQPVPSQSVAAPVFSAAPIIALFFILLLLLSIGVFSVWYVNVQSDLQVGQASSNHVAAPVSSAAPVLKFDGDGDGVADNTSVEIAKGVEQLGCPEPKTIVSTPSSFRYSDNGDGTVTDNRTGLIWIKNANCFGEQNLETAMQIAANLADGQCGLSDGSQKGDWRLPTKDEWVAMMDKKYREPALSNAAGTGKWKEGDAFTGVQWWYWSSTAHNSYTSSGWRTSAWRVYLKYAEVYQNVQSNTHYVWAVRVGQASSNHVAAPVSSAAPVLKFGGGGDGVADNTSVEIAKGVGQQDCPEPKTIVSTPSSFRYSDNGDGTVTDNRTGLIWMKNANC